MPVARYIQVTIDGQLMDMEQADQMPVTITYSLEDPENFQNKTSSVSFDIKFPATPTNDRVSNTFHDPSIEDMTEGGEFRSNRSATIEANGYELLVGKAFLNSATHNYRPLEYEYSFYGNNADWLIDLKETTLFDLVNHINFPFTKQTIIDSWDYDGRSEALPYVLAPVRYADPMEDAPDVNVVDTPPTVKDYSMLPEYMKPAISLYWIIYWGFKLVGYRILSSFLDTDYFRRAVMPWTWGSFQSSGSTRLENLKFLAKSDHDVGKYYESFTGIWDLQVTNDKKDGAFNNKGTYSYDATKMEMKWKYLESLDYGYLLGFFSIQLQIRAMVDRGITKNRHVKVWVQWFKNENRITTGNPNEETNGDRVFSFESNLDPRKHETVELVTDKISLPVNAGDIISAKIYLDIYDPKGAGSAWVVANVQSFKLDYFRTTLGSTIDFQNYTSLKNIKFTDLLSGTVDMFNLSIQTDPISKVVLIEPTHPYSLEHDQSQKTGGYFNSDFIDWNQKQDLSKTSTMTLFNDYEREVTFKLKDDDSDGMLKTIQDRYNITLAAGKYVFPDRFKADKKEIENRFFSAVMHYDVTQWQGLGSDPDVIPQMICLVPENISNASAGEAENTFAPKLAWYKGIREDMGWVFDGAKQTSFPFMFAVNYLEGGEEDPIFSYSDECIGPEDGKVVGIGILKRFYMQRMAIMRNGQYYDTSFLLNNLDITNWFHREHIICRGQRWELIQISNYAPLLEQSTECSLRRWIPVAQVDANNTFPSAGNVRQDTVSMNQFDIKYSRLKCLASDIVNINTD